VVLENGPDTAYLGIICFTARWHPQTSQVEGHGIERRMDPTDDECPFATQNLYQMNTEQL